MNKPDTPLLRTVSLTGADDQTELAALQALSARYPFVEWALLYVPHAGGPRNPTQAWRERFFEAQLPTASAVHLCFKEPFVELLAGTLPADVRQASRVQLNINARGRDFTDDQVLEVYRRALDLGPDVILQYQSATELPVRRFLDTLSSNDLPRVHVLLDESRGTGKTPKHWQLPPGFKQTYCGFAGGLGPANVGSVLDQLELLERPYWVDMETGIRTDNRFDLLKVEQVLQAADALRRR